MYDSENAIAHAFTSESFAAAGGASFSPSKRRSAFLDMAARSSSSYLYYAAGCTYVFGCPNLWLEPLL